MKNRQTSPNATKEVADNATDCRQASGDQRIQCLIPITLVRTNAHAFKDLDAEQDEKNEDHDKAENSLNVREMESRFADGSLRDMIRNVGGRDALSFEHLS